MEPQVSPVDKWNWVYEEDPEQNTIQYGIRSIQYSGAKLCNSIPSEIRLSGKQFRTELKKYYLKSDEIDWLILELVIYVFNFITVFDVMGKPIDLWNNYLYVFLCACCSLVWAGFLLFLVLSGMARAHLCGHLEALWQRSADLLVSH